MKRFIIIVFLTSCVFADEFVPIVAMHESGSIVNTTFFNAGGAFPANAASASLNPAIPAAWHFASQSMVSAFGSFYKSDYFDYRKSGGGGSLALGMGQYFAAEYNLKNEISGDKKFHRGTVAYGAMLDDNEDDPLFIGFNISFYNSAGNIHRSEPIETILAKNNVIAADLGFYQPGNNAVGLSWGIVLENILGYCWNNYGGEKSNNMLNRRYNSFLLATNLSLPLVGDKALLMVPLDIRFWGFMNRDLRKTSEHHRIKHRAEVHSGAELQLGTKICGRFGWAWIPEKYATAEDGQLKLSGWGNRFNGGFGINIGIIMFDALFSKDTFGLGASFQI